MGLWVGLARATGTFRRLEQLTVFLVSLSLGTAMGLLAFLHGGKPGGREKRGQTKGINERTDGVSFGSRGFTAGVSRG